MALLPATGLETHPLGTVGVNGILMANWARLEEIFRSPAGEDEDDPAGGVLYFDVGQKRFRTYPTFATLTYGATVYLIPTGGKMQKVSLTGNITFATSGLSAGADFKVIIAADGSTRNLTWPVGWTWIGGTAPATIAANKTGLLEIMATTGADSGVVARWTVQP